MAKNKITPKVLVESRWDNKEACFAVQAAMNRLIMLINETSAEDLQKPFFRDLLLDFSLDLKEVTEYRAGERDNMPVMRSDFWNHSGSFEA